MIRLLAYLLGFLPVMAFGHLPGSGGGGFLTGFLHPIVGIDHLIAMVAVGLWGAFLGERALWILPIVFPSIMAVGAAIGISGLEIPLVESVIALSGVVFGTFIMFRFKVPLTIAILLVGIFAIFHGYAHGLEMPNRVSAVTYGAGFVVGTGLLHWAGIVIGFATKFPRGELLVRGCGGVISLIGLTYLVS